MREKTDSDGCLEIADDVDMSGLTVALSQGDGAPSSSTCYFEVVGQVTERPLSMMMPSDGSTSFSTMIGSGKFVDKTDFIKASLEETRQDGNQKVIGQGQVQVHTHPRRTGKTSNMDMLYHYFSPEVRGKKTAPLFKGLKIFREKKYRDMQGTCSVIFISFKDVNGRTFQESFYQILADISELYEEHLCSRGKTLKPEFSDYESDLESVLKGALTYNEANPKDTIALARSLYVLTKCLSEVYHREVVVLIDEYDTPLLSASRYDYWGEMSVFMRTLFSKLFKGNNFLYKGVITGILRIAKEDIFSGLNNIRHFSVFSSQYSTFFGFTRAELKGMLDRLGLGARRKELESRYGYYQSGRARQQMLNPWSIVGDLAGEKDQWKKSADNQLVKDIFKKYLSRMKETIRGLLLGEKILLLNVQEEMSHKDLGSLNEGGVDEATTAACMSLLLHCGYLTGMWRGMPQKEYEAWIPNFEVLSIYMDNLSLFSLDKKVEQEIEAYYQERKDNIAMESRTHIFNKPKPGSIVLYPDDASRIADELARRPTQPVIIAGPAGMRKSVLAGEYVSMHFQDYAYILVLKKFHSGGEEREEECTRALAELFNITVKRGLSKKARASKSLFEKLRQLDSWLVIVESVSEEGDIQELRKSQNGASGRHILAASRKIGIGLWSNCYHVSLPLPEEKEAVSFIYRLLRLNNSSRNLPRKKEEFFNSEELYEELSKIAYYASYIPARMDYFCFLIKQMMISKGERLSATLVGNVLRDHLNRDFESGQKSGMGARYSRELLHLISMDEGDSRDPSVDINLFLIARMFRFSEKMMELYVIYLNQKRIRLVSPEFHNNLALFKQLFKGSENKEEMFRRFLMYLVDDLDRSYRAGGKVKIKLMAVSLFYSEDLTGHFFQTFWGSDSSELVSSLLSLRFFFGHSANPKGMKFNGEIWSELKIIALHENCFSLVEASSFVAKSRLKVDRDKVFDEAISKASQMMDRIFDKPREIFHFLRPALLRDDFNYLIRHYSELFTVLEGNERNEQLDVCLLRCQVAYLFYLQGGFDKAIQIIRMQDATMDTLSCTDYPIGLFSLLLQAKVLEQWDEFSMSIERYEKVIARSETKYGLSDTSRRFLVAILLKLDRVPEAKYYHDLIRPKIERASHLKEFGEEGLLPAGKDIFVGHTYLCSANYAYHQGGYNEAEELYEKALDFFDRRSRTPGGSQVYWAKTHYHYGNLLRVLGQYEKAEESFYRSDLIYRGCYLSDNRVRVRCKMARAKLYFAQEKHAKALDEFLIIISLVARMKGRKLDHVDALHYAMRSVREIDATRESEERGQNFFNKAMSLIQSMVKMENPPFIVARGDDEKEKYSLGLIQMSSIIQAPYIRVAHPLVAAVIHYGAHCYVSKGELLTAQKLFEESLIVNVTRFKVLEKNPNWTPESEGLSRKVSFSNLFVEGKKGSTINALEAASVLVRQKQIRPALTLYEVAKNRFRLGYYSDTLSLLQSILTLQDEIYVSKELFIQDREKVLRLLFHVYFVLGAHDKASDMFRRLKKQAPGGNEEYYSHLEIRLDFLGVYSEEKLLQAIESLEEIVLSRKNQTLCGDQLRSLLFSVFIPIGVGDFKGAISLLKNKIKMIHYRRKPFAKAYYYLASGVVFMISGDINESKKSFFKGLHVLDLYGVDKNSLSITRIRLEFMLAWCHFEETEKSRMQSLSMLTRPGRNIFDDLNDHYLKARKECYRVLSKVREIEEDESIRGVGLNPFLIEGVMSQFLLLKINTVLSGSYSDFPSSPSPALTPPPSPSLSHSHSHSLSLSLSLSSSPSLGKVDFNYFFDPVWRYMLVNTCPFWHRVNDPSVRDVVLGMLINLESSLSDNKETRFYAYLVFEMVFLLRRDENFSKALSLFKDFQSSVGKIVLDSDELSWSLQAVALLFSSEEVLDSSQQVLVGKKLELEAFMKCDHPAFSSSFHDFYLLELQQVLGKFPETTYQMEESSSHNLEKMNNFIEEYFRWVVPGSGIVYEASSRVFSPVITGLFSGIAKEATVTLSRYHCCIINKASLGSGRSVLIQHMLNECKQGSDLTAGSTEVLWFSRSKGLSFETMIKHYMINKIRVTAEKGIFTVDSFQEFIDFSTKRNAGLRYVIVLDGFDSFKEFHQFFNEYLGNCISPNCQLIVSILDSLDNNLEPLLDETISYHVPEEEQLEVLHGEVIFKDVLFSTLGTFFWQEELSGSIVSTFNQVEKSQSKNNPVVESFVKLMGTHLFAVNFLMSSIHQLHKNTGLDQIAIINDVTNDIREKLRNKSDSRSKIDLSFSSVFDLLGKGGFLGSVFSSESIDYLMGVLSLLDVEYLSEELIFKVIDVIDERKCFLGEDLEASLDPRGILLELIASSLLMQISKGGGDPYYRIHPIARKLFVSRLENKSSSLPVIEDFLILLLRLVDYQRWNPKTVQSSGKYLCYAVKFLFVISQGERFKSIRITQRYVELGYRLASYYLFHLRMPKASLSLLNLSNPKNHPAQADSYAIKAYAYLLLHCYNLSAEFANTAKLLYDKYIKLSGTDPIIFWKNRIKRGLPKFTLAMIAVRGPLNTEYALSELTDLINDSEKVLAKFQPIVAIDRSILAIELLRLEIDQKEKHGELGVQEREGFLSRLDVYLKQLQKLYGPTKHSRVVMALLLKIKLLSSASKKLELLNKIDSDQGDLSPLGNSNMQTIDSCMLRASLYYENPSLEGASYPEAEKCIKHAIDLHDDVFGKNSVNLSIVKCYYLRGRIQLFCGRYKLAAESLAKARYLNNQVSGSNASREGALAQQIQIRYLMSLLRSEQYESVRNELADDDPLLSKIYFLSECQVELAQLLTSHQISELARPIYEKIRERGRSETPPTVFLNEDAVFLNMFQEYMLGWSSFMMSHYDSSIQYAEKAKEMLATSNKSERIKGYVWFLDILIAFSRYKKGDFYESCCSAKKSLDHYFETYVGRGVFIHPKVTESLLVFIASSFSCYESGILPQKIMEPMNDTVAYLQWVVNHFDWLAESGCYRYIKEVCSLTDRLSSFKERSTSLSDEGMAQKAKDAITVIYQHMLEHVSLKKNPVKNENKVPPDAGETKPSPRTDELEPKVNKDLSGGVYKAAGFDGSGDVSVLGNVDLEVVAYKHQSQHVHHHQHFHSSPEQDSVFSDRKRIQFNQGNKEDTFYGSAMRHRDQIAPFFSDDDALLDYASLQSQRSIKVVNITGQETACEVLHAPPDGDCGFTSPQLVLNLYGKFDLARYFTRRRYIKLVMNQWNKSNLASDERRLISELFARDGASPEEWPDHFRNRWLEEVDFRFLSRHFNIKFHLFCEMNGFFIPLPSYEVIYCGTSLDSLIEISLVHVSTQLKSRNGTSLNHYDALVVSPTPDQVLEINRMNAETPERSTLMSKNKQGQATGDLPPSASSGGASKGGPQNSSEGPKSQLPLPAVLPKVRVDKRPNEMVYALLSQLAYKVENLKENLNENNELSDIQGLEGWWVKRIYTGDRQYEGVLFTCPETRAAVLAHKGTDSLASLWEDFEGIFRNKTSSSQRKTIFESVKNARAYCHAEQYNLSFTGHSLGAFLAELSVYYCHQSLGLTTTHAVTFESPGCKEGLISLQSSLTQGQIDLDALDIMGYVSYPNLVNTCNHHVGTLCHVKPVVGTPSRWLPLWLNLSHLVSIHTISNFIKIFQDSDWRDKVSYMSDWPLGDQRDYFFKHATLKDGAYGLSQEKIDQQQFVLDYEGHYTDLKGHTFKNSLPLIHFNSALQEWLKRFYDNLGLVQQRDGQEGVTAQLRELASEEGIDETVLLYLLSGQLVFSNKTFYFVQRADDNAFTPSTIRHELSAWISNNSRKAGALLMFGGAPSHRAQTKMRAMLIEPGGELTETGVIENARIANVFYGIPKGASSEDVDHLKDLSEHFFKNAKSYTLESMAIARGAKVAGTLRNIRVATAVFEVQGNPEERSSASGARYDDGSGLFHPAPKGGGGGKKQEPDSGPKKSHD